VQVEMQRPGVRADHHSAIPPHPGPKPTLFSSFHINKLNYLAPLALQASTKACESSSVRKLMR
jgi:hypothetical protein